MLSSFRFASNSIFGDGYGWDSDQNGFIKLFKKEISEALNCNNLSELEGALSSIENSKISTDIIAFFFALSQNKLVKEKKINSLDFSDKLENNSQLKYIFALFYGAIIYYIAHLMKAKGLQQPLTIAFSGNGSKTLRALSPENDSLVKYIKLIFEKVYNRKYDSNNELEIIYEENPKLATCKGGIINPIKRSFDDIESLKCSLLGINTETLVDEKKSISNDDKLAKAVTDEVHRYIDFIFELNENNGNLFKEKFDADPTILLKVKDMCNKNLLEYTRKGINSYITETNSRQDDNKNSSEIQINETLFFLPIIGMLNNVAREIAKLKK